MIGEDSANGLSFYKLNQFIVDRLSKSPERRLS